MNNNTSTSKNLSTMFTYIALRQLQAHMAKGAKPFDESELTFSSQVLLYQLGRYGLVGKHGTSFVITKKGAEHVARIFKTFAEELSAGHLGKFEWSKRTKFHKEVMARIA